mgnify:FL=1
MIPSFLIEKLKNQYGEELTNKILEGYNQKRKVTLRVNTIKANINEIQKILDNSNIVYTKVPWSDDALIIENVREPEITKLTIYDEGKIYLQSLSSMLPPIILQPKENDDILDMAAAPGGKTTQIASIVNNKARITACEMNNIRAEKLKYNIEKQGANCVYVMVTDSRKIDDFFSFDSILLDAPCSGSGTLNNNDNKIEKTFTPKLIQKSSKTQAQLLKKAINILKQGKEMIYSTCSILQEENEDILASILKKGKVEIVPINVDKTIPKLPTKIDGTLCVCPNEEYEGFFVAKIRKIAR